MRHFLLTLTVLTVALIVPGSVSALTSATGNAVVTDSASSVNDVYTTAGGSVDLAGTFGDDVYAAGGTVAVSAPVSGDVFAAGGNVKITGEVKGSVRIAGGTVELGSKVGRNVLLMGGTLTIGPSADVAGEVLTLGGTLTIDGHVAKPVVVWGGTATINGKLDSDVSVHTSSDQNDSTAVVRVGPSAVIGGNLTYWASRDASIDSSAKIAGKTVRHDVADQAESIRKFADTFFNLVRLWNLFSLLVVGLLVGLLFPKTLARTAGTMVSRSGASIGWGVLVLFAFPIGLIVLFMTVIGIPLGLLLLGLYAAGMYLSQLFLGYFVGERVVRWLRRSKSADPTKPIAPVWLTLLGVIIIVLVVDYLLAYLATFSLVLGFIIGIIRLFLLLWPFGALILTSWATVRERESQ